MFDYAGGVAMRTLAHWWNGMWGGMVRKDVWVELLDDGRYDVHWHGGQWRDRDGHYRTRDRHVAWWAVRELIGDGSDYIRADQAPSSPRNDERDGGKAATAPPQTPLATERSGLTVDQAIPSSPETQHPDQR